MLLGLFSQVWMGWSVARRQRDTLKKLFLGGGATGGLTGVLIGLGIPDHETKRYEVKIK